MTKVQVDEKTLSAQPGRYRELVTEQDGGGSLTTAKSHTTNQFDRKIDRRTSSVYKFTLFPRKQVPYTSRPFIRAAICRYFPQRKSIARVLRFLRLSGAIRVPWRSARPVDDSWRRQGGRCLLNWDMEVESYSALRHPPPFGHVFECGQQIPELRRVKPAELLASLREGPLGGKLACEEAHANGRVGENDDTKVVAQLDKPGGLGDAADERVRNLVRSQLNAALLEGRVHPARFVDGVVGDAHCLDQTKLVGIGKGVS
ncbi:hypothetical protein BC937DRAFT_93711 [Endogone sp. FLAS-F59071]|nr:hypothetical protein BC937DRAFT_93711 [Endogone sp. FLAS-F59071]|eukprot:RUS14503.1 hypothetical protein BC937DRAFT_93711 [Endogone sp. FLAS-F59071]